MLYKKILQILPYLFIYLFIYFFLFGTHIINPKYLDWLLVGGDASQHQIGWEGFRKSDWFFPIGMMDTLTYPNPISVIFTDSIPIFALFFKALSPILPSDFQYFGIWMLLCILLQGFFAFKIIYSFSENRIFSAICSLLFIFYPGFLYWTDGALDGILGGVLGGALGGQWILLAGLYLVFNYKNYLLGKKIYGIATLLAFLASSIHIYFTLECGIILFIYCLEDFLSGKSIKRQAFILSDYVLTATITIALLGGFSSVGSMAVDCGLGVFSMNLHALFNPMGWSSVLDDLPLYTWGQYEGFGYLGIGGILLLYIASYTHLFPKKQRKKSDPTLCWGLAALIIICLVIALSPIVSFNNILLYELSLPKPILWLWSIFRSSGRLVVIIGYVVLLGALKTIWKNFSARTALLIVLCCLGIQLYDLKDILSAYRSKYNQEVYVSSLSSQRVWNVFEKREEIKHVFITNWIGEESYYTLAKWAIQNGKTTSSFAVAHPDIQLLLSNVKEHLLNPQPDELFLFVKGGEIPFLNRDLHYYNAGNYIIGTLIKIDELSDIELKLSE